MGVLCPAGRSFARDYGTLDDPVQGVLTAAQATDVVLDAIARSDGTRASVLRELRTVVVPEEEMGLRVDIDLPRLHHRAMGHVDRTAARVEPLAETSVRRIEAECGPRRQRTADDPVVKCLETFYCHSIPPDLLSSNARVVCDARSAAR